MIGARCERGAEIARQIGMSEATAQGIRSLDEHWNGAGYPDGRKGEEIPLLARIMNVSQTMEVFASAHGPAAAVAVISERSGTWFDPEIARLVRHLQKDEALWLRVSSKNAREYALQMEPGIAIPASPQRIDDICRAFAEVIDTKSPYTYNHSLGVARAAVEIAEGLGLAPQTVTMVRRAALLHDIGKLSVSNSILEKPGALSDDEWRVMKLHPAYTRMILQTISGFEHLAFVASVHHERLDGSGYPDGLAADELPLTARIVCVADTFQAITEDRPYRAGRPARGRTEHHAKACSLCSGCGLSRCLALRQRSRPSGRRGHSRRAEAARRLPGSLMGLAIAPFGICRVRHSLRKNPISPRP